MKNYNQILSFLFCLLILSSCEKKQVSNPSDYDCVLTFQDQSETHPYNTEYHAALDGIAPYLPAMQVSTLNANNEMWSGSVGYADIPNNVAMQACTKTMVGSISKIFTGVLIMQLVEEGVVDLDDPLSNWLEASLIDPIENANEVNIQQLLNHTTGIRDYLGVSNHIDAVNTSNYILTQVEKMELIHGKSAEFTPGEKYSYSNSNYVLLGLIIEKARNMALWDVIDEYIVLPLGLQNTVMGTESKPIPSGTARPYLAMSNYKFFDIYQNSVADAATGDGGISSNMQDLVIFLNALKNGELVSEQTFQQMLDTKVEINDSGKAFYGLGIETIEIDNYGVIIGHGGSTSSYFANLWYLRDENAIIAFGSNCRFDSFGAEKHLDEFFDKIFETTIE